jgi:hypothetical protein
MSLCQVFFCINENYILFIINMLHVYDLAIEYQVE